MEPVEKLYRACGTGVPAEFEALRIYIKRFNAEAEGLRAATARLKDVNAQMEKTTAPPSQQFYASIAATGREIRAGLPQPLAATDERYRSLAIGAQLALELGKTGEQADDLAGLFGRAEQISADLAVGAWGPAEQKTRELAVGNGRECFSDGRAVPREDRQLVRGRNIQRREGGQHPAGRCLRQDERIDDPRHPETVCGLCLSTRVPPYVQLAGIGRSRTEEGTDRRLHRQTPPLCLPRSGHQGDLQGLPPRSERRGVDRARAIVEHGKMYKGTDKQIAGIVSECDPMVPKSITRAKEYRRVFAFPVTNNRRGTNEYVFRLRLQIPVGCAVSRVRRQRETPEGARGSRRAARRGTT